MKDSLFEEKEFTNQMLKQNHSTTNRSVFWEKFFERISNGESLRGVSNDLDVPFQTIWSSI